jgi:oligogalacturonide lyase
MKKKTLWLAALALSASGLLTSPLSAQIGQRFPSERKVVPDPVTGVPLTFLTSTQGHSDSKIYQTHHQWTSDGKWVIFRSNRGVPAGQAMAVNEETGDIVQVTEAGFTGMLCVADHSMSLYFLRPVRVSSADAPVPAVAPVAPATTDAAAAAPGAPGGRGRGGPRGPTQVISVDLGKLFADSAAGKLKASTEYEHVRGTIPTEMGAGDMALDPTEDYAYVRTGREYAATKAPADLKIEGAFGNRGMGGGPTGLISVNLHTGEIKDIVTVGFQMGHVQTNPWMPGEIVFCWETGGKAPQRTWTVKSDGTGLRPLFPEAPYDWITHEAVITQDEVAIAMLYLRAPLAPARGPRPPEAAAQNGAPQNGAAAQRGGAQRGGRGAQNGPPAPPPTPEQAAMLDQTGKDEHPTGVGIVNLRTHEMRIVGQVPIGDPGRSIWHVNGSPDGRWAVADDFQYRLWIIDRHSGEMKLLADMGHVTSAADHIHPTFNADSTKVEIQSAMLSEDKRSLNVVVVPVPPSWLARTYDNQRLVP